jgi:light-regulated signal transduction histidine kinase (bacteriophytochrome)
MVGSMFDLSPIREFEEQLRLANAALERSNEELQRFAYAVSHDLKAPLRTIGGLTELFEKRYRNAVDEDGQLMLQMVVNSVARMNKLITDLLDYSRVTMHSVAAQKEIDCNNLISSALLNLQQRIEEAEAMVTSDSLPIVTADDQLLRVFQNLIENGIKYRSSERKPTIHVSVERRDEFWVFSVRDNGIGFEMKHADRLFVVFQRLHGQERYEGSGIGLAICRRIVERLGGEIWVDSEPEAGSTFYFSVPAASDEASARFCAGQ